MKKFLLSINYKLFVIGYVIWLLFGALINFVIRKQALTSENIISLLVVGFLTIAALTVFGLFRKKEDHN